MYLYEYEDEFYAGLEHGEARLKGIKRALDNALEKQDIKNALYLYNEYVSESIFYDDCYYAIIIFPEYLALFEKYPEYQNECKHDVMWAYKWVVFNMDEYHQIPLSNIINIYKQYEDFCTRFNYNKRTYYQTLESLLISTGIRNNFGFTTPQDYHIKSLKCSKDSLSDCQACELDSDLRYILSVENDYEKALNKATPLFTGRLRCAEVPHVTYVRFAEWCFKNGDIVKAKDYADKGYRLLNRDLGNENTLSSFKGNCILVFAYSDVEKALKAFKKTFGVCYDSKNGYDLFSVYLGSYHLMLQLEKSGKKHIRFKFPDKLDPIYKETSTYAVTDLKDYFYEKAKQLADKFDERNQNSKYNDELNETYNFEYPTN
ncbi:MAG: hypothetical protein U0M12_05785 [Acutalibacteraceae bacterium]|nr:hypothetical protein [Acutalibacteraceae bacterium]